MIDPRRYPAQVFWSDEDNGFIAIAPDLPGSSAYGETEEEAIRELRTVIELGIESHKAVGNPVPPPSDLSQPPRYSGRLLLRMPKSLHQALAEEAEREAVSLNQYLLYRLSRGYEISKDLPQKPVQKPKSSVTPNKKIKRAVKNATGSKKAA